MVRETEVKSHVESYQKMVLDVVLLNIQLYKVRIMRKAEPSRERSNPPRHFGVVAIEKEAFGSLSTKVVNFFYLLYIKTKNIWFLSSYRPHRSQSSITKCKLYV